MNQIEIATMGGGRFWCIEAVFKFIEGVFNVTPGYAGGHTIDPFYHVVCSGNTGHAEVVQIVFCPCIIAYEDILQLFFKAHDPTSFNRQGPDFGTQYRSIILYHSQKQKKTAEKYIKKLNNNGFYPDKILTELKPLDKFYPAEEQHHDFFQKNPFDEYCVNVISPKLKKLNLP